MLYIVNFCMLMMKVNTSIKHISPCGCLFWHQTPPKCSEYRNLWHLDVQYWTNICGRAVHGKAVYIDRVNHPALTVYLTIPNNAVKFIRYDSGAHLARGFILHNFPVLQIAKLLCGCLNGNFDA